MKKLILTFVVIATMGLCCKDEPPTKPTPTGTVKLSLDYAECKEIGLKLSFTDANQPRGYALLRDGEQITSGTLGNTEILLVDTTVFPGRDYTYIAQRLNGSLAIDASSPLPVHSLDSTSHNIQWFVDTLGAQGVIRDVWVFDKNNAIAVGEIYLRDSTGQINMSTRYNAARWDGNKWDLKQINPEFQGYTITPPLDGIFCSSPTQIWMIGSLPIYGDGTNWTIYDLRTMLDPNLSVSKAWGSDTKNVFFVGRSGSIARFNGSTWSKMPSNTTVDLEDIYGIDENHIWATGTNGDYSSGVLLSYDGTSWIKHTEGTQYEASSVWTNNNRNLYLAGSAGYMVYDIRKGTYSGFHTPAQYRMFSIHATDINDIFFTGQETEVTHFNGSTFYLYTDLQNKIQADTWWSNIKVTKDFLLVGGSTYVGSYFIPTIARGYR